MNKHLYLCHPLVLSSPTLMMHDHMNLKSNNHYAVVLHYMEVPYKDIIEHSFSGPINNRRQCCSYQRNSHNHHVTTADDTKLKYTQAERLPESKYLWNCMAYDLFSLIFLKCCDTCKIAELGYPSFNSEP